MTHEKFIDLCILCGCDYTTNIQGVGPVKAFKFMHEEGMIENVLKRIEQYNDNPNKKTKYYIPDTFYYKEARELFRKPNVEEDMEKMQGLIKWNKPEEELLKDFLVNQKGFSE